MSSEPSGQPNPPAQVYLEASSSAGRALLQRQWQGPILTLNLLRFRDIADYAASPELAPPQPISGRAAFERYIAHTLPYLHGSGGEVLLLAEAGEYLIGPAEEAWHMVMLVRQASLQSFLGFAIHTGYLAGIGHRSAALLDSRLLPLSERLDSRWPAVPGPSADGAG